MAERTPKTGLHNVIHGAIDGGVVESVLAEVSPRFISEDNSLLRKALGLNERDYLRFHNKLSKRLADEITASIRHSLLNGVGVEFPRTALIFRHDSTARTTKSGAPFRKVSVRTRVEMTRELNPQ